MRQKADAIMTYLGGVEDGKSYMATQILRICNKHDTDANKLEYIARACRLVLKDPTKERIPGFVETKTDPAKTSYTADDRSLAGWNDIIERSAET